MEQAGTAASTDTENTDVTVLLNKLKSDVYHENTDELALGLGRPAEEINAWLNGSEEVDEDAEMKIRRLAEERLGKDGDDSGPEAAADPDESIEQRI